MNDYGTQIERFAESIRARAKGEEPPEDGYQGDYVTDLAARIDGAAEMDADELARRGVELMLAACGATLERFRVHMDRFSHERANHEGGAVKRALDRLRGARARVPARRRRVAAHHHASATTRTAC